METSVDDLNIINAKNSSSFFVDLNKIIEDEKIREKKKSIEKENRKNSTAIYIPLFENEKSLKKLKKKGKKSLKFSDKGQVSCEKKEDEIMSNNGTRHTFTKEDFQKFQRDVISACSNLTEKDKMFTPDHSTNHHFKIDKPCILPVKSSKSNQQKRLESPNFNRKKKSVQLKTQKENKSNIKKEETVVIPTSQDIIVKLQKTHEEMKKLITYHQDMEKLGKEKLQNLNWQTGPQLPRLPKWALDAVDSLTEDTILKPFKAPYSDGEQGEEKPAPAKEDVDDDHEVQIVEMFSSPKSLSPMKMVPSRTFANPRIFPPINKCVAAKRKLSANTTTKTGNKNKKQNCNVMRKSAGSQISAKLKNTRQNVQKKPPASKKEKKKLKENVGKIKHQSKQERKISACSEQSETKNTETEGDQEIIMTEEQQKIFDEIIGKSVQDNYSVYSEGEADSKIFSITTEDSPAPEVHVTNDPKEIKANKTSSGSDNNSNSDHNNEDIDSIYNFYEQLLHPEVGVDNSNSDIKMMQIDSNIQNKTKSNGDSEETTTTLKVIEVEHVELLSENNDVNAVSLEDDEVNEVVTLTETHLKLHNKQIEELHRKDKLKPLFQNRNILSRISEENSKILSTCMSKNFLNSVKSSNTISINSIKSSTKFSKRTKRNSFDVSLISESNTFDEMSQLIFRPGLVKNSSPSIHSSTVTGSLSSTSRLLTSRPYCRSVLGNASCYSPYSSTSSSSKTSFLSKEEVIEWQKGKVIDRGAYGTVYQGLTNKAQLIAVKEVDVGNCKDTKKMYIKLQGEVAILKALKHRNIIKMTNKNGKKPSSVRKLEYRFIGTSLEESCVYIFMEYIAGGSIAGLIANFGPLSESVYQRYTKQIMEATAYIHKQGVIHRDIKGANILITVKGIIKLIDFGCAKELSLSSGNTKLLKSVKGTPYWMSPEVIRGTGCNHKSDIWSIGCTIIEMAKGKPPWSQYDPYAALFNIAEDSCVPPQLESMHSENAKNFVELCLTRDMTKRPSAEDLMSHPFICI